MSGDIRAATSRDLPAVVQLSDAWVREETTYGQTAPGYDWFADRLAHYFFVAVVDGDVVGYSQGEFHNSDESVTAVLPIGTPFVEITSLYVAADRRRLGLGGRLLDAILDAAKRDGVDRSLLFTGTKDVLSIARFYARHGYDGWGIQMVR
jgi:GNAT superfamily N-acetyltransferase